jgi:hypothetical protein
MTTTPLQMLRHLGYFVQQQRQVAKPRTTTITSTQPPPKIQIPKMPLQTKKQTTSHKTQSAKTTQSKQQTIQKRRVALHKMKVTQLKKLPTAKGHTKLNKDPLIQKILQRQFIMK